MKNQYSCIAISILAIAILFICSRRKEGMLKLEVVPENPGQRVKVGTVYLTNVTDGVSDIIEEGDSTEGGDLTEEGDSTELSNVIRNIQQINSEAVDALDSVTQRNMDAVVMGAQNREIEENGSDEPIKATTITGTGLQSIQPRPSRRLGPLTFGMYSDQTIGKGINPNHLWVDSEWCKQINPAPGTVFETDEWQGKLVTYNPNDTNRSNKDSPEKGCFMEFDTPIDGKVKYGEPLFYIN